METTQPNLLLVRADVLPEVFSKVLAAKQLLQDGVAKSTAEATKQVGLSRSAFYKYRDTVFAYNQRQDGQILTLHFVLNDKTGVLSALLTAFSDAGANILTVNQNIPTGGAATVSVSARVDALNCPVNLLIERLMALDGVIRVEQIISDK